MENPWHAPWAYPMRLRHVQICTTCAMGILNASGAGIILCIFAGLARVFSQTLGIDSHYKYQPFSFRISRS